MRYALQRILQFLIVFFIVTFGVMVLLRLGLDSPGDPARTMLGGAPSPEQIDEANGELPPRQQLPRPVLVLANGMLTGDFGFSVQNNLPVSTSSRTGS